jgi:hypothetical protein
VPKELKEGRPVKVGKEVNVDKTPRPAAAMRKRLHLLRLPARISAMTSLSIHRSALPAVHARASVS